MAVVASMADGLQGISLSIEQYKTFISLLPDIERVLEAKGVPVPRPQYDKPKIEGDADEGGEVDAKPPKRNGKRAKPNHEATSDEDEG